MRGPPIGARRAPLNVPFPPVPGLRHVPAAVPAPSLIAVSCQSTLPQGARATEPVTVLPKAGEVCAKPSMQSMMPRSSAGPAALDLDLASVTSQVPLIGPRNGSLPCQEPAQTPVRSGPDCVDAFGSSPPPTAPPPAPAGVGVRA